MYKVLIVDDEPRILTSLTNIIPWKEYGFKIEQKATNGFDAQEVLNNEHFDLLITDIRMPKMTGIELIESIRKKGLPIKIIILSAHDEFKYVKEAITLGVENYILKPINKNELIETLIKVQENIEKNKDRKYSDLEFNMFKENLLIRWINGSIENFEFEERAQYASLPIDKNYYCIFIVKLLEKNNYSKYDEVKLCIDENLSRMDEDSLSFIYKINNIVVLLSNDIVYDMKRLKAKLNTLILNIEESESIDVFITIGGIVRDFTLVSKSFHESLNLLDYSLFMYKSKVISKEDIALQSNDSHRLSTLNFDGFIRLVEEYDVEKANHFIENIFYDFDNKYHNDIHFAKKIIREILLQLSMLIRMKTPEFIPIPEDLNNLFEKYYYIQNNSNVLVFLHKIIVETINFLKSLEENRKPIINLVLNYINNRYYDKSISLKTLSYTFKVNSSYLGQLFKSETGELFSNYLNIIRIEKAKEIMQQKNLRLSEIAKMSGYTNQSYFQKNFKKYTGISPSEYKITSKKIPINYDNS